MENTQELIFCWETCTRWLEFHEKHNRCDSLDGGAPSFGATVYENITDKSELASLFVISSTLFIYSFSFTV